MESKWSHWTYEDEDYEMAQAWTQAHGREFVPAKWLPRTGFIIVYNQEPVLMFWVYFEISCPVAFIDWVISRPKSPHRLVRQALVYAVFKGPLPKVMIEHGAEVAWTRSPTPFVRTMVKYGWAVDDTPLYSMQCVYGKEELLGL
jgi:hypothetical protein